MFHRTAGIVIALTLVAAGCSASREQEYELRGQIVAVDQARQQVTIKHEDIPRFMPGMTMAFKVSEKRLLDGRQPGDLVKATLVVRDTDVQLRTLERVGFVPLPERAADPGSALLAAGELVRDAAFVDESGAPRKLSSWRGTVLAVTFVYTRCPVPTFCPLIDRHFKAVQDGIQADAALGGQAHLLSVTLDPQHDTPPVLADHARRVGADPRVWTWLTGSPSELAAFGAQFGITVLPNDSGSTDIVHNLRTAIISADGRLVTALSGSDWSPADLLTQLRTARAGR